MQITEMKVEFQQKINSLVTAWEQHPAKQHYDFVNQKFGWISEPDDPVVILRYTHEDFGRGCQSGLIGNFSSLCHASIIGYGAKKFGIYDGIFPIEPWMEVNPTRIVLWSCKDNNAFACRQRLKDLLPPDQRKVVNQIRKFYSQRKKIHYLLDMERRGEIPVGTSITKKYPIEYRRKTRDDYLKNDEAFLSLCKIGRASCRERV